MKHSNLSINGRVVRLNGCNGIVTAYVDGEYVRGMYVSDRGTAWAMACTIVGACGATRMDLTTLVANRIHAVTGGRLPQL